MLQMAFTLSRRLPQSLRLLAGMRGRKFGSGDPQFSINLSSPLKVGDSATLKRAFSEAQVLQFANLSLDTNPIHVDAEAGKNSIFKQRVVHGIFTGAMFSPLCYKAFPLAIYMKQDLKFIAPVFFDEEVEAKIEVSAIDWEKKRISLKTTVLKLKENKAAIVGEALVLWPNLKSSTDAKKAASAKK